MIGRSGERWAGISVLAARHDDDDDDKYSRNHFYPMIKICQHMFIWYQLCLKIYQASS